ncbi:hypothetical protein [Photobacterium leiognathi]|uniref:hypothetical protein n=1 Tax=Photobacterium leiognathi TaxID=553611 RepID=UPI002980CCB7|nr:hypothetical protein [Photobacterium leiognathi]
MIKNNAKWIVLVVVAMPILGWQLYPLLSPSEAVIEPVVVNDNAMLHEAFTPPVNVERVMVELDGHADIIVEKTTDLRLKELDTLLAEQELKTFEVKNKKSDSVTNEPSFSSSVGLALGLDDQVIAPLPQGSAKPAVPVMTVNPLNRLQLNSLITVDGQTIAYVSVDGQPPLRVKKGSKVGGAVVSSVSENSVTVTSGKLRRVLTGIGYE